MRCIFYNQKNEEVKLCFRQSAKIKTRSKAINPVLSLISAPCQSVNTTEKEKYFKELFEISRALLRKSIFVGARRAALLSGKSVLNFHNRFLIKNVGWHGAFFAP